MSVQRKKRSGSFPVWLVPNSSRATAALTADPRGVLALTVPGLGRLRCRKLAINAKTQKKHDTTRSLLKLKELRVSVRLALSLPL